MRRAPGASRCPPRTSPQRLGQGTWSDELVSPSFCALILWFAWVVEVEVELEGVTAPSFFAVGICLVLVLFFAAGDLLFAGFFAGVVSLLIVPDKLPEDLDLPLAVPLFVLGVLDASRPQGRRYTLQPAAQHLCICLPAATSLLSAAERSRDLSQQSRESERW